MKPAQPAPASAPPAEPSLALAQPPEPPELFVNLPRSRHHPGGGVVLDASLPPGEAPWRWLDPGFPGNAARPLAGRGGRGSAWFLPLPDGDEGVLREYRRGGLPARLGARRLYLWQGADNTRCLREFRLLRRLEAMGLPVPRALAAGWWRVAGLWYRQALLTRRLEGTRSLGEQLLAADPGIPWTAIGATLARFHRAGVGHPDLNAHNILLDDQQRVWLIDFDRADESQLTTAGATRNLERLSRSILRITGAEPPREGWGELQSAWRAAMAPAAAGSAP